MNSRFSKHGIWELSGLNAKVQKVYGQMASIELGKKKFGSVKKY